jgi:DNA-binding response OmpR family regulator
MTRVLESACLDLKELKLLVVEDNFLIAEMLCHELRDLGCAVTGPTARVKDAMRLATDEKLDGALLDIDLGGEFSFPVAAVLASRGVPFGFVTGYTDSRSIPEKFRKVPCLAKPFMPESVADFVNKHFGDTEVRQPHHA